MNCPKCGYNHAEPPKCRACGTEITEEPAPVIESVPTVAFATEVEETPTEEAPARKTKKK